MSKRFLSLSVAVLSMLVLVGCQNSGSSAASSAATPQKAVVINGGQGGATVVYLATSDPDHPMMLSTVGAEVCPDCRAAAVNYFKTGQLEAKCPKCGATRTATALVPTNVGHQ